MTLTTAKSLKRNQQSAKGGKKEAPKPAAKATVGSPVRTEVLDIESLIIDHDLQQRAGGADERTVREYADDLLDGVKLPPIKAIESDDGGVIVWDGFQRIDAHKKAGLSEISVEIMAGSRDDAMWLSCSANKSHGLRRKPEDKRKAVSNALMLERTQKMSDRQIAEHCGASPSLVGVVRKELVASGEIPEVTERVSSSGRKVDTSKEALEKKTSAGKASAASGKGAAKAKPKVDDRERGDDADAAAEEGVGIETPTLPQSKQAKPAASKVTADVKDGIMLDAADKQVPEELVPVFSMVDGFHKLKRFLDQLAAHTRALAESPAGTFLDPANADILEGVAAEVLAATPYFVREGTELGWEPTHPDKVTYNSDKLPASVEE